MNDPFSNEDERVAAGEALRKHLEGGGKPPDNMTLRAAVNRCDRLLSEYSQQPPPMWLTSEELDEVMGVLRLSYVLTKSPVIESVMQKIKHKQKTMRNRTNRAKGVKGS